MRSVFEERPWRVAWAASQNADLVALGDVYVCTLTWTRVIPMKTSVANYVLLGYPDPVGWAAQKDFQ